MERDDDREISWAPRKIRELQAQVKQLQQFAGFDPEDEEMPMALLETIREHHSQLRALRDDTGDGLQRVARKAHSLSAQFEGIEERLNGIVPYVELAERVRRLESQTEFETSEDDARLKSVERRLAEIERTTGSRWGIIEDFSPPVGGRKLIGPAHAHLDAPCTEACYEPVRGVVHPGDKIPQFGAPWAAEMERDENRYRAGRDAAITRFEEWARARLWVDESVVQEAITAMRGEASHG